MFPSKHIRCIKKVLVRTKFVFCHLKAGETLKFQRSSMNVLNSTVFQCLLAASTKHELVTSQKTRIVSFFLLLFMYKRWILICRHNKRCTSHKTVASNPYSIFLVFVLFIGKETKYIENKVQLIIPYRDIVWPELKASKACCFLNLIQLV